jgi:hypothetical protein
MLRLRFLLGKIPREKDLDCNYYVLRDNLAKAKQFKDVPRMLKLLSTGLDLIHFMKIVSSW